MDLHGLDDLGLVLDECAEFWRFVFRPVYRRQVWREWREASLAGKAVELLNALWHVFAGLAPVLVVLAIVVAILVWAGA